MARVVAVLFLLVEGRVVSPQMLHVHDRFCKISTISAATVDPVVRKLESPSCVPIRERHRDETKQLCAHVNAAGVVNVNRLVAMVLDFGAHRRKAIAKILNIDCTRSGSFKLTQQTTRGRTLDVEKKSIPSIGNTQMSQKAQPKKSERTCIDHNLPHIRSPQAVADFVVTSTEAQIEKRARRVVPPNRVKVRPHTFSNR